MLGRLEAFQERCQDEVDETLIFGGCLKRNRHFWPPRGRVKPGARPANPLGTPPGLFLPTNGSHAKRAFRYPPLRLPTPSNFPKFIPPDKRIAREASSLDLDSTKVKG